MGHDSCNQSHVLSYFRQNSWKVLMQQISGRHANGRAPLSMAFVWLVCASQKPISPSAALFIRLCCQFTVSIGWWLTVGSPLSVREGTGGPLRGSSFLLPQSGTLKDFCVATSLSGGIKATDWPRSVSWSTSILGPQLWWKEGLCPVLGPVGFAMFWKPLLLGIQSDRVGRA